MKLTNEEKKIINDLLQNGTASGPVSRSMIDLCLKWASEQELKSGRHEEFMWMDFLAQARKETN